MRAKDIEVGNTYRALVSGKITVVRVIKINPNGGYWATNIRTGRTVKMRTAARFHERVYETELT